MLLRRVQPVLDRCWVSFFCSAETRVPPPFLNVLPSGYHYHSPAELWGSEASTAVAIDMDPGNVYGSVARVRMHCLHVKPSRLEHEPDQLPNSAVVRDQNFCDVLHHNKPVLLGDRDMQEPQSSVGAVVCPTQALANLAEGLAARAAHDDVYPR